MKKTQYSESWCEIAIEFFSDYVRDENGRITGKPTVKKLADRLGVSHDTISRMRTEHPEFDAVMDLCLNELLVDLIDDGALTGQFSSSYAQFYLSSRKGLAAEHKISGAITMSDEDRALLQNIMLRLNGEEDSD